MYCLSRVRCPTPDLCCSFCKLKEKDCPQARCKEDYTKCEYFITEQYIIPSAQEEWEKSMKEKAQKERERASAKKGKKK